MLAEHQWSDAEQQCSDTQVVSNENELLQKYSILVKRAAAHLRSLSGAMVDSDDLLQVGLLGLLSAIRRYGREPDEYFEAYAFKRVRGAMLDEFRRTDWRARQQRQQAHQFRDASRDLMRQLGRAPTHEELSQHLGIDNARLHELMYLDQAESMESLDALLEQQQHAALGETSLSALEVKMSLKQAMADLPERNKLLLHLYYSHELNMKEIALVLELTESRVCQLHKQSIEMLNKKLSQW
ncbi:FliA/WhiG family RNA polymerase sigma factor [Rheinheimera sp. 4Y26]|uniref:FliA/WhiG family RNA polymerase sigma factor n=1 Tax=Rheinheimera sp. 4Y26 TaxID=2977811 RepID=UPI0021B14715|nr:FliA/WhiG family RNA polymerase sigma factor [Rheinheimera sp. 4Y26]MCT6699855.1 FliA/WhiG family RNA polymerase sigma factor [Rheinheimera sp. 4Y26]